MSSRVPLSNWVGGMGRVIRLGSNRLPLTEFLGRLKKKWTAAKADMVVLMLRFFRCQPAR